MTLVVWLPKSLRAASLQLLKAAPLLLLANSEALAQDESLQLTWDAPPGCPTESEVARAALDGAATHISEPAPGPTLIARARVTQQSDESARSTWHVLLHTQRSGAHGQREIKAESCAGLAQATAVVLSLALLDLREDSVIGSGSQNLATADFDAPDTQTAPIPESAPDTQSAQPKPSLAPQPRARRHQTGRATKDDGMEMVGKRDTASPTDNQDAAAPPLLPTSVSTRSLAHFSLGAQVGFNIGTLPRIAPGGALSLAWLPGIFRLEVDAKTWGQQSQSIEDTPSGARLLLRSVGMRACVTVVGTRHIDLSPCLGSKLHLLSARGFGSDSNYDARATWPAVTGGLLGRAKLTSRFLLRADVESGVPLARPRFFVERIGTVHRIPPWAVTTLFGAEIHFP